MAIRKNRADTPMNDTASSVFTPKRIARTLDAYSHGESGDRPRLSEESRAAREMIARFGQVGRPKPGSIAAMRAKATGSSCSGWWIGRFLPTFPREMRLGEQEVPSMVLN